MKIIQILYGLLCICSCEMSEENHVVSRENQQNQTTSEEKKTNFQSIEGISTNCYFDQLSNKFNFRLIVNYVSEDSAIIIVTTSNKRTDDIVDSIMIQSEYLMLPPMYGDCKDVRSYSTGFNKNKEVVDNCPGDFIVADFNFDGLEDFAVAVDNGGNGGYIYSFYNQNKMGRFENDQFLTEEMQRFPVLFDEKRQKLMTSVHANAYQNCETVYQLSSGGWKQISKTFRE